MVRCGAVGKASPLEGWLHALEVRRVSPATLRSYRFDVLGRSGLLMFLREEHPDAASEELWDHALHMTSVDLSLYVRFLLREHGPQAAPTVRRKVASLRAFLEWALRTGLREKALPETPKLPVAAPPAPRWLTRNETNALLRAVERHGSPRDLAIVVLLLETGLRVGELCGLRVCDVEVSKKAGVARVLGKGAKVRLVPLNTAARAALRELGIADGESDSANVRPILSGQRGELTPSGVLKLVRRYGKLANLKLSPHTLRHTFCRRHLDSGTTLPDVALMTGHTSLDTTKRYLISSRTKLQEACENPILLNLAEG